MKLNDIYQKIETKRKEKIINNYIDYEILKEQYDQYLKHLNDDYKKCQSSGRILIRKHGIGSMIISKTFIIG